MKPLAAIGCSLLVVFAAVAMPSKKEIKEAESIVAEIVADDMKAFKAGSMTAKEAANVHRALARKTKNPAEKFVLYQDAFEIYAQGKEYDLAADALEALCNEFDDVPSKTIVEIVSKSMKRVSGKEAPRILTIFNKAKHEVKCRKELRDVKKELKARPGDAELNKKLGECLAELGDWDEALAAFAKASGDLAKTAKCEKDGSISANRCADFWWGYSDEKDDAYKAHAVALYQKALFDGSLTGLLLERAKKRIEDAREAGVVIKSEKPELYCVIDLSGGADASLYPVMYFKDEPDGGFNTSEYKTTKLVLKRVEAGSFIMGENQSDGSHRVTLTKPFYMGLFEMTQKQWELVMGENLSYSIGDTKPVEQVSYRNIRGAAEGSKWPSSNAVDADSFLGKLRERTGLAFDLPTEAQWEYTCRAGTTTKYSYGDQENGDYMWYRGNSRNSYSTKEVGTRKPNGWGFYDMHGNVFEWCLDWYERNTLTSLTYGMDPKGPSSGFERRFIGSCWYSDAQSCVTSYRKFGGSSPGFCFYSFGFRLSLPFATEHEVVRAAKSSSGQQNRETVTKKGAHNSAHKSSRGGSANTKLPDKTYCVIDLSGGVDAESFPVMHLNKMPEDGFDTIEYKTTKLVLKRVKPGTFIKGEDQTNKAHRVTLTKSFYMGIFEVTQKQWELVMGTNPSCFVDDVKPVEQVSYNAIRGVVEGSKWPAANSVDASSFLGVLRAKTGLDFDLPTWAQWEYTCRAGTTTMFSFGDSADKDYMWYGIGAGWDGEGPREVGTKLPNGWGFYDMHGNVYEWCLDWWSRDSYGIDPKGGAFSNGRRVYCGGCWNYAAWVSKSSEGRCERSSRMDDKTGFRLCLPTCCERENTDTADEPVTTRREKRRETLAKLREKQREESEVGKTAMAEVWTDDFDAARKLSKKKGLPMMLDFTGSDWCGWCQLMDEKCFAEREWKVWALKNLVCVKVDFPRDQTKVTQRVREQNMELRERFGVRGYPTFVLLASGGGKEIGRVSGGLNSTPEKFIGKLKAILDKAASDTAFSCKAGDENLKDKKTDEHEQKKAKRAETASRDAKPIKLSKAYCIIDLSAGEDAESYPVTQLDRAPSGGFNTSEYKTTKLILKRVKPGTFEMGQRYYSSENVRRVKLTKPFYMGIFEVTQKQWELVMGVNPCSSTKYGYGDAYPVHYVSYNKIRGSSQGTEWPASNAVDDWSFLGKLREKTNIEFDLPTEAQWEYVCRAKTNTEFSHEDKEHGIYMWYKTNAENSAHEVGTKKPNKWDFYDMHGNVEEWCLDWYAPSLPGGTDPVGWLSGDGRVTRGGSWRTSEWSCASASRNWFSPSYGGYHYIGFRLAITLP